MVSLEKFRSHIISKKYHGKITTLIEVVVDMIVMGNDLKDRNGLQDYLVKDFRMKDLCHLKYFLGN